MSDSSARPRYVRGGARLFWPGVAIALMHVGLMFVSLMVVFAGRTVVAIGVLALIVLAGLRLRCENDEVLLRLNLLVYQADIPIWVHSWRPAHPGDDGPNVSGVREPRRPIGPGPMSAAAALTQPTVDDELTGR